MQRYRLCLSSLFQVTLSFAVASLFTAGALSAQSVDNGFSLGLGGGFARGFSSPFSTGSTIGYYMQSTLETPSPFRMLRPRADLFFADWGGSHVTGLTGNLLFSPISGKRVVPYALAGAGAFATPGSTVKSGWTLGLGLRLPGEARSITIESRIHAFLRAKGDPIPYDSGNRWRTVVAPIGLGIQF